MRVLALLWGTTHDEIILISQIDIVLVLLVGCTWCTGVFLHDALSAPSSRHPWLSWSAYWRIDIVILDILQILCFLAQFRCCDRSRSVLCRCKVFCMLLSSNLCLNLTWLHRRPHRNSGFGLLTPAIALSVIVNESCRVHLLLLHLIVSLN